jgi:monoterpene epsilon-lactone hydrolase
MTVKRYLFILPALLLALAERSALAADERGAAPPSANGSFLDDQGQAHITRVVPVPLTVSPEAQAVLSKPRPSILSSGMTFVEQRAKMDARQAKDAEECKKRFPATVTDDRIAGVPVRIVRPAEENTVRGDRVLINLHGGGFTTDAGSLLESIPIASLTHTKVVAVLYRLAPEHAFPDALDDAMAVYRELLKTYESKKIGIYGTSAGGILTAECAVRIKQLGLPMPAAVGLFSTSGDFSRSGDSTALFSIQGLSGTLLPRAGRSAYTGSTELKDPVLSPHFADLKDLPPSLFLTSTRDMLLSGTVMLHLDFVRAGNDAKLVVFEALPHAFWLDDSLPESREADQIVADFFERHLAK